MASPNEVVQIATELIDAAINRIVDSGETETLDEAVTILASEKSRNSSAALMVILGALRILRKEETESSGLESREAAKLALHAGDHPRAEQLAGEMLEQASDIGSDHWNYGNLIHDAHLTIGRARLAQGDLDAAESELRSAGETPGSPQLNSFGPDLSLAWDLLKLGRVQAATEYFIACSHFWSPHRR